MVQVGNKKECVAHDPAIPHLNTYPRELKTCPHKNLYMNVHSSIFIMARNNPNNIQNKKKSGLILALVSSSAVKRDAVPVGVCLMHGQALKVSC